MKKENLLCWLASHLICAALNLTAGPMRIELPAETGVFKTGPGVEIANGQCLVCHSVEYVATQPPLPRAFWTASVKKMREKYGAAIPEEQVEPLLDYLALHYGAATTNAFTLVVRPVLDPILIVVQPRDRLSDHLRRGVAKDALGARVPSADDAVEVLADDRVVGRLDHGG